MIQNFTRRHGNQLCTSGNLGDKIYIEHIADYVSVLRIHVHVLVFTSVFRGSWLYSYGSQSQQNDVG